MIRIRLFGSIYWSAWNLLHRIRMARLIARIQGRRQAARYFIHGVPTPWN